MANIDEAGENNMLISDILVSNGVGQNSAFFS